MKSALPPESSRPVLHRFEFVVVLDEQLRGKLGEILYWAPDARSNAPSGACVRWRERNIVSGSNAGPVDLAVLILGTCAPSIADESDSGFSRGTVKSSSLLEAVRSPPIWWDELVKDVPIRSWLRPDRSDGQQRVHLELSPAKIEARVVVQHGGSRYHEPPSLHAAIARWLFNPKLYAEPRWFMREPPPPIELPPKVVPPEPRIPRPEFRRAIERFVHKSGHESGWMQITGGMGHGKTSAMALLIQELGEESKISDPSKRPIFHFIGNEVAPVAARSLSFIAASLLRQFQEKHAISLPEDWDDGCADEEARLQAYVFPHLQRHLVSTGQKELILLEAADQTDCRNHKLIPGVLGVLPEGLYGVVTTRPNIDWRGSKAGIAVAVDFEQLVPAREIGRQLVKRRNSEDRLGIPATFIDRLFSPDIAVPPVLFTIRKCLDKLKVMPSGPEAERLRSDPAPWQLPPEDLVREELDDLMIRATGLHPRIPPVDVLRVLGRCAALAEAPSPSLLVAMGWDYLGEIEPVLRLAQNFFHPRGSDDWHAPWVFTHPGYRRALIDRLGPESLAIHQDLARRCGDAWRGAGQDSSGLEAYALKFLPTHLREGLRRNDERGQAELVDLLCDPAFIAARMRGRLLSELLSEFQQAVDLLAPDEARDRTLREQEMASYIDGLVAFARYHTEQREPPGASLPAPDKRRRKKPR